MRLEEIPSLDWASIEGKMATALDLPDKADKTAAVVKTSNAFNRILYSRLSLFSTSLFD